ncbi:hypothetical protein CL654_00775 [bacterium]|nr:hypothetical protein [bacterium]|tara:strand:- start:19068 stop:20210 length:1143 start_codon:yes stop_codon:yes gene_type:complete
MKIFLMRKQLAHAYQDIISVQNLLLAWREFLKGKRKKIDVQVFNYFLLDEIFDLHQNLRDKTYKHGTYHAFNISDPKPRNIHKATVRDRLLHHAIYRILYPFFHQVFIADSYSCRIGKGTHKALKRFKEFSYIVSKNNTKTCWVLKCDIRKFFASIDQSVLMSVLTSYIPDEDILWLLRNVVGSFHTQKGKGLPLGNLTSQLLVNVYMNEFDQFMKYTLKAKYYIRYADDFVVFSNDKKQLETIVPVIEEFLWDKLRLRLHPDKISIKTLESGVDFLGWVHFPQHRILRTTTKRRMFKNIKEKEGKAETVQSYLGLLSHGNTWKLQNEIKKMMKATKMFFKHILLGCALFSCYNVQNEVLNRSVEEVFAGHRSCFYNRHR